MTALIAGGMLVFLWGQNLDNYTLQNMQRASMASSTLLENDYSMNKSWSESTFKEIDEITKLYDNIGIEITDDSEQIVYTSDYDNHYADPEKIVENHSAIMTSAVLKGGEHIGQVYVWAVGGKAALMKEDYDYRSRLYLGILFATIIAVLIASIIGSLASREMLKPIKIVANTANELRVGNLSARTALEGNDEIYQLGMTFDEMADSIQKDYELERRLTSDVAHELRTPLMAIQSTVEAMVDGVLPLDYQRLNTLNSEVVRLSRLVEGLLKLSKLESGSMAIDMQIVDLSWVISDLMATHQMMMEDSGLSVEFETDEGVYVMADADLIRQATSNLLSNAVRYTDSGGHVFVSVKRREAMAAISVRDSGIGLSEKDLKQVFSRFWRADEGRDRASGGLGIGLSLVNEIAKTHNGWVDVQSALGIGSIFTIMIPLFEDDFEEEEDKKAVREARKRQAKEKAADKNAEKQAERDEARRKKQEAKESRESKGSKRDSGSGSGSGGGGGGGGFIDLKEISGKLARITTRSNDEEHGEKKTDD
jgi:signal transduction histidine kinase